jgi:UDP-glucuronate 4-epimerase
MAIVSFTKAILENCPIDVYNNGQMKRGFTYIDDIVEGVVRVLDTKPAGEPPYKLYNIGNQNPVELLDFIAVLEECLGKKAQRRLLPMQAGDVPATFADVEDLMRDVGFRPDTPIEEGIRRFTDWYREYYRV